MYNINELDYSSQNYLCPKNRSSHILYESWISIFKFNFSFYLRYHSKYLGCNSFLVTENVNIISQEFLKKFFERWIN